MPSAKKVTVQPKIAEEDEVITMTKNELALMMKDEVDKMKDDLMEMMREVKDAIGTNKTSVAKSGKTAAKKVEKTPIFLPFTGAIYPNRCQKICVHGGMFSQCQNSPEDGSNICKICNKPTNSFDLIQERLNEDGSINDDWTAHDGRKPISFGAYLHNKKYTIENAKEIVEGASDILEVDISIPDEWYIHVPGKPGRKKKLDKKVTVASDTEDEDDDDQELPPIKNANIEKSKADDKKAAKEAEKQAKQAAKLAEKEAKKSAKKAAKKAEKEAAKKAEKEAANTAENDDSDEELHEEKPDEVIVAKDASSKKSRKVKKKIDKVESDDKVAKENLEKLSETFADLFGEDHEDTDNVDMGKMVEDQGLLTTRKVIENDSDGSDWESDNDNEKPKFTLGSDSDSDSD